MGWFFTPGTSRKQLIEELTAPEGSFTPGQFGRRTLRHCTRGNVLWSIVEVHHVTDIVIKVICCDLLQRGPEGWGHKPMSEEVGPCYYTCPLGYLDAVEPLCEAWRKGVRAHHARRKTRTKGARL